ncbi:hypothetical protein [Paraburkholderia terricola]|uniref:Cell wall surface anchor family protein n=1 Tax=Paraburkholderia terricola TaxID=169427 RepID=A0ABU1LWA1_9BURK|nr:hypothetical protein [Paraburkholderia terricola]MDR6411042.1 hypothetical protein [Paraburkholderia terricola]MDR6483277.1 hypothetical protein [Paraburkholderia terricola]
MADSAASTQSRPPRAASRKRRQATVSTETENKLARAARSAQRLAQLSDATRDDSTLDLFPDDPTRATLEAMNIDIRQGTLHGFELPDVVLAAVGAIEAGDGAPLDAKAARRAPRAAKSDEPVPVNAQLSGLETEPLPVTGSSADGLAVADVTSIAGVAAEERAATSAAARDAAPLTPAMAAATVARSVTALRQAAEPGATAADHVRESVTRGGQPQPRSAAAAAATKVAAASLETSDAEVASEPADRTSPESGAVAAERKPSVNASASARMNASANSAYAAPLWEAQRAEASAAAQRAAPELDRARATAFADTVDALYGVIADQRRAATDHSRRMKWMLSIVVGALLVTVAIGITQTVLLMRLTRETTAQQHRIEALMQNQQAAMASLLDTHMTMARAAASEGASAAAVAAAPAAPQQAAATPAQAKRAARAQHAHKPKAATSH